MSSIAFPDPLNGTMRLVGGTGTPMQVIVRARAVAQLVLDYHHQNKWACRTLDERDVAILHKVPGRWRIEVWRGETMAVDTYGLKLADDYVDAWGCVDRHRREEGMRDLPPEERVSFSDRDNTLGNWLSYAKAMEILANHYDERIAHARALIAQLEDAKAALHSLPVALEPPSLRADPADLTPGAELIAVADHYSSWSAEYGAKPLRGDPWSWTEEGIAAADRFTLLDVRFERYDPTRVAEAIVEKVGGERRRVLGSSIGRSYLTRGQIDAAIRAAKDKRVAELRKAQEKAAAEIAALSS